MGLCASSPKADTFDSKLENLAPAEKSAAPQTTGVPKASDGSEPIGTGVALRNGAKYGHSAQEAAQQLGGSVVGASSSSRAAAAALDVENPASESKPPGTGNLSSVRPVNESSIILEEASTSGTNGPSPSELVAPGDVELGTITEADRQPVKPEKNTLEKLFTQNVGQTALDSTTYSVRSNVDGSDEDATGDHQYLGEDPDNSQENVNNTLDPDRSIDMRSNTFDPSKLKGEVEALEREIRETSTLKKVMISGKMMLNQYMVIKTLGKGTFGTVRLCFNLNDKTLYAIKTLNKKTLTRNRGLKKRKEADPLADLKREVAIMKKLRHPNLVKLFEVIDDPVSTKLLMVMEHVQGGPIRSDKTVAATMSEQVVVHYFRDMCMGLDYLHFNHIAHMDLKPDNMLLSAGGEVKITDFGCSRVLDEEGWVSSKTTGTPLFHAPEMTTGQPYIAYAADIWALGVTLYVFIFGVMPFEGKTISELHENIANKQLSFPSSLYISDELKDLLSSMLTKDPAQRISLPDIMGHSWVTQGGMACINSLQHLQNPPEMVSNISDAEQSDAIRSDTCVALMQPCFEEVVFNNGEHLIRAGERHDVVFYICSGQCEVVQMVSSMRTQLNPKEHMSNDLSSGINDTTESAMFSHDDWSCFDVANPNSSMVDSMYQSLDKLQVVHFEHVVRTLSCGSFVGNVEELDCMDYFSDNVSVVAKGTVSTLAIQKNDLVQFLASRPEIEKVLRGRMAQAKTDKLVYKAVKQISQDLEKTMKS